MELEIEEIVENPLLQRKELRFRVKHPGAPTPRRVEVKAKLAEALGVGQEVIAIEKITSLHGKAESSGIARVYKTEEILKSLEPKYLLEREKPPEEEKK
jgi:small subunit ribosomal protein S24e